MNDLLKFLVVDDSLIIVRKLSVLLEKVGWKVVRTAATGKEAVEAYRACKPDMVTMDITMPEMNGIEATRAIMKEFPDARIIMVTSHGQENMVLDALKAGAKGYVLKPFQEHKVFEAIEKACKGVVLLQDKLKAASEQYDEKAKLKAAAEQEEKAKLEASAAVQPGSEVANTDGADTQSSGSSQIKANAIEPAQSAQPVDTPANSSQQQTKFCKECGSAIATDAKFCSGCGFRLA